MSRPLMRLMLVLVWLRLSAVSGSTEASTSNSNSNSNRHKNYLRSTVAFPKSDSLEATPPPQATPPQDERSLAVYALYNVPPFAVTFRTQHTPALESALEALESTKAGVLISETNGIDSSLSFPIRSVTQTFLLEQLKAKIVDLKQQQDRMDADQRVPWFRIYDQLGEVDLAARLYLMEGSTLAQQTDIEGDASRRSRHLVTHITLRAELFGTLTFAEPADKSTKPSNDQVRNTFGTWMTEIFQQHRDQYLRDLVQSDQALLQQMSSLQVVTNIDTGTAGAPAPTPTSSSSDFKGGWSQRTEKALFTILIMLGVLGVGWLGLSGYHKVQHRRETRELLQSHDLHLDRPPSLASNDGQQRSSSMDAVRHGKDVFHRNSTTGAMSILESTDRYLSKHRPDLYQDGAANGNNNNNSSSSSSSSFNVFGLEYSIPANPFEYIYSAFGSDQQPQNGQGGGFAISPQGAFSPRNSINSNSNSNTTGGLTSTTPYARRSSLEIQENNIAATPYDADDNDHFFGDDYPDDEGPHSNAASNSFTGVGHWSDGGGYRPISSIWRNLTNGLWDSNANGNGNGGHGPHGDPPPHRPDSMDDGLVIRSPQSDQYYNYPGAGMELQDISLTESPYRDEIIGGEDESYNFAFQDFPRHDGTPCLMYNEEAMQEKARAQVFEIGSPNREGAQLHPHPHPGPKASTTPVSDAAFQRMLLQHGQGSSKKAANFNGNGSFEDSVSVYSKDITVSSNGDDPDGNDNDNDNDNENGDTDPSENKIHEHARSPVFTEKLGRLMQQKHRQYEKKAIVEKHQEKRAKERKEHREQERKAHHKAMAREIDDLEAAFSPPPATTTTTTTTSTNEPQSPKPNKWASSPNPYQKASRYSPKPSPLSTTMSGQYSPKPSGAYRSGGYSPFRSSATAASTIAPSPSRRQNQQHQQQHTRSNSTSSGSSIFRPQSANPRLNRNGSPPNMDQEQQQQPFRMRPRTTQGTGHTSHNNSGDLYVDTAGPLRVRGGPGPSMPHPDYYANSDGAREGSNFSLDNLSMPAMTIDDGGGGGGGTNNNINNNNGSGGSSKFPSPSSVMDDLLGAPMSISRKKAGASTTMATMNPHSQSQQNQQQHMRHRRVNSLEPSSGGGVVNDARPIPQQRRRFKGSNGSGRQHLRSLTPTRDPRMTLNGAGAGGRASTPTRGMPRRDSGTGSVGGGAGGAYNRSSSNSREDRSRSNSFSSEDVFTHGIVAQTRFV